MMTREELIKDKTEIEVRRMRLHDLPEVVAIEQACFSQPWTQNGFEDALFQGQNIFVAALDSEEKVVGYAGLYTSFDEGDITNVAVDERVRGRGIGQKIIQYLLLQARAQGVRNIFLEVRKSNDAAKRLYEKNGFHVIGERKAFYRNPTEDALLMSREEQ